VPTYNLILIGFVELTEDACDEFFCEVPDGLEQHAAFRQLRVSNCICWQPDSTMARMKSPTFLNESLLRKSPSDSSRVSEPPLQMRL
jgi:hypothetical protein